MSQEQTIDDIKQLMLAHAIDKENKSTSPNEMLSGSGNAWFYDPIHKTMEMVRRGDKVVRNRAYVDHKNRILSYISGKVVLIPEEEIVEIGYN